MIQVGIVAPTPALRAGLRAMLNLPDVQVTAEAGSLLALLAPRAHIDGIIVADETLLDDLTDLERDTSGLALVILTDTTRMAAVLQPLPLRGWALVPPDVPPESLLAALAAAVQGLVVFTPALAQHALARQITTDASAATEHEEPLTSRESEVLALLSQGLSNKMIAQRLQISEHTVKFHVSSIYAKLGASSRTEAVSRGARRGLVSF
ncbi:MAG: response regulator transcription factor [Chloroflexaceae bacterium]|nr:response regulator transcription factor [Chloroflexaceae bacterium]NJO08055.1 response regulator transcription factor [Chloroflexaceae bacterium]